MEFSEIAELDRYVGITRSPKKTITAQTCRQYLDNVKEKPLETLVAPSPLYVNRAIASVRKNTDSLFGGSKGNVSSSDDQSYSQGILP